MSDCNQTGCRNLRTAPAYQQRSQGCPCNTGGSYARQNMQRNMSYAGSRYGSSRTGNQSNSYQTGSQSGQVCYHQTEDALDGFALAMGYVPWQHWQAIYEPDKGLQQGTIFMELDKPFLGCRGGKRS